MANEPMYLEGVPIKQLLNDDRRLFSNVSFDQSLFAPFEGALAYHVLRAWLVIAYKQGVKLSLRQSGRIMRLLLYGSGENQNLSNLSYSHVYTFYTLSFYHPKSPYKIVIP